MSVLERFKTSVVIVGALLAFLAVSAFSQSSRPVTCSEIVGDLYIQNAQLSQQLREANAKLAAEVKSEK